MTFLSPSVTFLYQPHRVQTVQGKITKELGLVTYSVCPASCLPCSSQWHGIHLHSLPSQTHCPPLTA